MKISDAHQAIINDLQQKYPSGVLEVNECRGDVQIRIDADRIHDALRMLHDDHRFIYLSQIFGADRFTSTERFEVIYNLFSLRNQLRLFVKVWLEEKDPALPTATDIWRAANWHEREVYDMFGIRFTGHPDLRRMYMPEDFEYYPLRKEFPVLGIPGSIDLPSTTPDSEES